MPESRGGPARPSSPRWLSVGAASLAVGFAAGAITVPLVQRHPAGAPAASPATASDEDEALARHGL